MMHSMRNASGESQPEALARGLPVRWWDFLFYVLFGLVAKSFVPIAGVLRVFNYLIGAAGLLLRRRRN